MLSVNPPYWIVVFCTATIVFCTFPYILKNLFWNANSRVGGNAESFTPLGAITVTLSPSTIWRWHTTRAWVKQSKENEKAMLQTNRIHKFNKLLNH